MLPDMYPMGREISATSCKEVSGGKEKWESRESNEIKRQL